MEARFTMTRTVKVKCSNDVDKEKLLRMVEDVYGDEHDGECFGVDAECGGFEIKLGPAKLKHRNKP